MEILADAGIASVTDTFSSYGTVRTFDGRRLHRSEVGTADVLLVRSVTRVDAGLLDGTSVRFVGTSTAGIDHVDTAWLAEQDIAFADAAGCNARAVAEHVALCVLHYAREQEREPGDLRVGVIGYGHTGRAVGALLRTLGIAYVVNDPPLGEIAGETVVTLDDALCADVVTLHVPLTGTGAYPTEGLLDASRVAALKSGALLINAARGGIVDEAALVARAPDGVVTAIDCWAGEPDLASPTLAAAWRATPHIAGHTREARLAATRCLERALGAFLGTARPGPEPAPDPAEPLEAAADLGEVLERVHPLTLHTTRLRRMLALPVARRAAHFDDVRARYGLRREFAHYSVARSDHAPDTVAWLEALGCAVS